MLSPDPVLELIERFERNPDHYKRPAYKETQVRGEHEDMPDNQDRVAAGVGGEWLTCGGRLRDRGPVAGVPGAIIGAGAEAGLVYVLDVASKLNENWRPVVFGNWARDRIQKRL